LRWVLADRSLLQDQPRPTADIDIAVDVPDDATAKARVGDLLGTGYLMRESVVGRHRAREARREARHVRLG